MSETQKKPKKKYFGKLTATALALILASILTCTVLAIAYVNLTWTTTATVAANPKVCFIKWSDSSKANTFSYTVNIFPSVITADDNITYGVWDWDTAGHNTYFKLLSYNTNATDISWAYYKIYNGTGILYQKNETNWASPSTAFSTANFASANAKYTIQIQIKAGASAVAGHTPTFVWNMKVDNP